jgi:hypothetical protein
VHKERTFMKLCIRIRHVNSCEEVCQGEAASLIKDSKVKLHRGAEASGQSVCVVGFFRSTAVRQFVKVRLHR